MTKETRSTSTGKPPISRHPLFPATVAIWFSALFGLGSLAIRPSLLESIVMSLQLDAVFASLAPPLGTTARIVLALIMATIGGYLGIKLARRIANPASINSAPAAPRRKFGDFLPDLSKLGFGKAQEAPSPRRRSLALKEETRRSDYVDHAPVPGAAPLILDVAEMDLEGCGEEPQPSQALSQAPSQADESQEYVMADVEPTPSWVETPEPAETPRPADVAEQDAEIEAPEDTKVSLEVKAPTNEITPDANAEQHEADLQDPDHHEDGPEEQVAAKQTNDSDGSVWPGVRKPIPFEAGNEANSPASETKPVELPRFDMPHAGAKRPGTVFDQKPAAPLFGRPASANLEHSNAFPFKQDQAPPQAAPVHEILESPDSAPQGGAMPVQTASVKTAETQETQTSGCDTSAAERIASTQLGDLSHVELLERLAISLKQRRQQDAPAKAAEAIASNVPDETVAEHEDPVPSETLVPEAVDAQKVTSAVADVPTFSPDKREAISVSPAPVAIPAALRPVGFGDDEEDLLPSHVPPRHFSTTAASSYTVSATMQTAPGEGPELQTDDNAEFGPSGPSDKNIVKHANPAVDEISDQDPALEEGYSSLLNLSLPATERQPFVRIEEPEAESNEIEPVVVFPGQGTSDSGPFAKPAATETPSIPKAIETPAPPENAADPSAPPPFAPPAELDGGDQSAPRRDSEETERALRTALATLQRMSGAA